MKEIIYRGCPFLFDLNGTEAKLSPKEIHRMFFVPACEQLWDDFQRQKLPKEKLQIEISYRVLTHE